MLNKVILMGRLTRDPEKRHTQNGTAVASFSLAVERDFKEKNSGERATDFIDIVAWRQSADFVCKYFTKGQLAVVEGRLQVRNWVDDAGNKRRTTEVVADNIYFAGAKPAGQKNEDSPPPQPGEFEELNDDDGELPF